MTCKKKCIKISLSAFNEVVNFVVYDSLSTDPITNKTGKQEKIVFENVPCIIQSKTIRVPFDNQYNASAGIFEAGYVLTCRNFPGLDDLVRKGRLKITNIRRMSNLKMVYDVPAQDTVIEANGKYVKFNMKPVSSDYDNFNVG